MAKITKSLVYQLANELRLADLPVTNLEIRKRNENSGSLTTIAPLLKEWRDEQLRQETDIDSMPEDLLLNSIKPLWAVLKKETRLELAAQAELFKVREAELQTESAQFTTEFDRQERQISELVIKLSETDNKLTGITDQYQKQTEQLSEALAVCEGFRGEKQQLEVQIGKQEQLNEKQHLELTEALAVCEGLRVEKQQLELQVGKQERLNEKQLKTISTVNDKLAAALTENAVLTGENTRVEKQLSDQVQLRKQVSEENLSRIKELETSEIALKFTNTALTKKNAELTNSFEERGCKIEEQKDRLKSLDIEVSKLSLKISSNKEYLQTKLDEIAHINVRNSQLEMANGKLQDKLIKQYTSEHDSDNG